MYKVTKISKENNKIKIIYKIISLVIYIIMIPIIIFNFTMIIKSFINPTEIPDFFGYKNFIIVSGSIIPSININDTIIVKEVPQEEIKVNDIISFKQGEIITTHRVINIIEEEGIKKYQTKGDSNNTKDKELVTYKQIEGKYQFKLSGIGKIIEILKNKWTLITFISIVIICYWYGYRIDKRKIERSEKRKRYKNKNHSYT